VKLIQILEIIITKLKALEENFTAFGKNLSGINRTLDAQDKKIEELEKTVAELKSTNQQTVFKPQPKYPTFPQQPVKPWIPPSRIPSWPQPVSPPSKNYCGTCGIDFSISMGYVCGRTDCPTSVTSGSTITCKTDNSKK
jgi:hypothetical protein